MSNHPSSSVSSQSGSSELSSLEGPPNHGFDQSDELLHHLAISVGLEIGTALGGSRLTTATLNALVSHFVSALMGEAPYPSPEWFRAMVEAVMSRATTEMALDVPEEVRDEVDARVVEGVEALIQYILVELEEKRESTREGRQQKNLLRKQLWGDSLSVVAIGLEESFWDRYAGAKVALYRSNRSETHDGQSSNAEVRRR